MEHLRHVARSRAGPLQVATEAAWALADLVHWVEPQGLVPACRRLVEWHPAAGALWNLAVRMLAALDPAEEARLYSRELMADTTAEELALLLPDGASVRILGGDVWRVVRRRRPDVIEARWRDADLALVEAEALGPGGFVARSGAGRLCESLPTWVVAPTGSVVGAEIWKRLVARLEGTDEDYEILSPDGVEMVVGP